MWGWEGLLREAVASLLRAVATVSCWLKVLLFSCPGHAYLGLSLAASKPALRYYPFSSLTQYSWFTMLGNMIQMWHLWKGLKERLRATQRKHKEPSTKSRVQNKSCIKKKNFWGSRKPVKCLCTGWVQQIHNDDFLQVWNEMHWTSPRILEQNGWF